MFTKCDYINENSKCLRIEVDTFGEVGSICLQAYKASEDDRTDFERMY